MNKLKGPGKIYQKYMPHEKDSQRIVIDSVPLRGLSYEVKEGHIILYGRENGTFSVDMKVLDILINEIQEIREVYSV